MLQLRRKSRSYPEKPTSDRKNGDLNQLKALITKAYGYSEITRLREKIVAELSDIKKTLMVTSPCDNTGNTFVVSVLGYSAAYFHEMKVLLIDLNMRRPELHLPFGLTQEKGFTDILIDSVPWPDVVKPSGLVELDIITAGKPDQDLSFFLNRPVLPEIIPQMKKRYDLIVFDTSPILVRNRNNLDPIYLSTVCDMVIVVAQEKKTSKNDLRQTVSDIQEGGGQVRGIVYNKQFHQSIVGAMVSRNGTGH